LKNNAILWTFRYNCIIINTKSKFVC
jgi:hypothetical protein